MVDATLRMGILNIFLDLKEKSYASIIYITHDLATAYYVSDYIMVMYRGNVMEFGDAEDVLEDPLHPYTRILLESLLKVDPRQRWREEIELSGLEVKEFEALGYKFANRCPYAKEMCFEKRRVSCWLYAK
ncbi:MAG: ABC transporter ATP-binding protein [Thermoprotei archaeon]|nr:ABC transporter ATP-binding protein [Thermoprotei archaeon]